MFEILLEPIWLSIFILFLISINLASEIREFRVNNHIKLKLEGGRTNIYVNNRVFSQCMYLLLNIPVNRIEDYDEIDSIDEAAEKLDRSMEGRHGRGSKISPEEEFMGHCSNIQAWAENGYDTRILHRNLAFPLLKRLAAVGDPLAKKVFKEEIAIRYASGHPTVINFLTQNGYLKYLSADEFEIILEDIRIPFFQNITRQFKDVFQNVQNTDIDVHITYLVKDLLRNFAIQHIPLIISHTIEDLSDNFRENLIRIVYNMFKERKGFPLINFLNNNLKYFNDLDFDFVKYENKLVGIIKDNKIILSHQNIKDINIIKGLDKEYSNIEDLDLSDNLIKNLNGIEKFSNLKHLKLNNNQITSIKELDHLKKLQILSIRNNKISDLRELNRLVNVRYIDFSGNTNIEEIPESLNELSNLETLKLWNCNIKKFSSTNSKFFWMEQNYRYFKGYSHKDKEYYEKTHNKLASSDHKLYKKFVIWLIKMRREMRKQKVSYREIENFEDVNTKNAVWAGRVTLALKKWLDDKKQKRITDYF